MNFLREKQKRIENKEQLMCLFLGKAQMTRVLLRTQCPLCCACRASDFFKCRYSSACGSVHISNVPRAFLYFLFR